ncbi:stage III sporulation protein AF [Virgibacillus halodenitrificans]|jgi:stage III sporulation protein AF|uniref:Stage III sporulation protein AF n=1 Tax=Virgibacillus halodenitrificans TaxID=1482 RepID=A0AAC9IYU9_VIRHA|nr:stage III sporulation protein AF [Virgibacillus halodenitrificans]APC48331.1 stage III sporulation protein AF [Virgibacillus halodenitrificans]MCJ0930896.1 stage III sporulation protein AF [Virgibacillus halodenitrificans]MEC2158401.1 stage III sporulation protein AF [Virgibacillus halodenitrificans]MYL57632.1 stage III sporulation protein AF [Virgibacillus halodenitrificans]WHX27479.1 stage III sporulation protein AF [Virgibacillus halodenitrificans]
MSILIDWITQIIIFLLLATVIELLVSSTKMKKYVKLVTGLILVLILLKPIFYVLQIDIEQAVRTSINQVNLERNQDKSITNLIEFQKSEIQTTHDAYILKQMAVQLTEIAEKPLLENYRVEIKNIDFQFTEASEVSFEGLEKVIVYIKESKGGEGAVSLVDDVVIDMNNPVETKGNENNEQIESFLRELWEMGDKDLTVIKEGGIT